MRTQSVSSEGGNLPPRVGAVGAALWGRPPLPCSVKLRRVAGFVRLFRVLRSAPSPPAQTSLQGPGISHCAGAAVSTLPVPICPKAAAMLSRSLYGSRGLPPASLFLYLGLNFRVFNSSELFPRPRSTVIVNDK